MIEGARNRPYVLGEWDCFRLACAAIEALTGEDRWPAFGGYTTKREALAALAQHGSTFEYAGDWFFRGPRINKAFARRGDILALIDPSGKKHLGVCTDGLNVAVMLESGLLFVRLSNEHCLCAWRVG